MVNLRGACAAFRLAALLMLLLLASSVYLTKVELPKDDLFRNELRVSSAAFSSRKGGRTLQQNGCLGPDCFTEKRFPAAASDLSAKSSSQTLHQAAVFDPKAATKRDTRDLTSLEKRTQPFESRPLDHKSELNHQSISVPTTANDGGNTLLWAARGVPRTATEEVGPKSRSESAKLEELSEAQQAREQVKQCIVQRGGGLTAISVTDNPCKIQVMHPPGVNVTWKDSQFTDAREYEFDLCQLAVYWDTMKDTSLILTKEYIDSHDAAPAVLHRMRVRKSGSDLWCSPLRCLHILRGHLPDRPPLSPGHFKRCALVGNSADLLKSEAGEEIDSHDAVFRMNAAPTRHFSRHVGSKTTFRIVNNRAWTMGLGAVSESEDEVLIVHGLFSREIFKEMRFGVQQRNEWRSKARGNRTEESAKVEDESRKQVRRKLQIMPESIRKNAAQFMQSDVGKGVQRSVPEKSESSFRSYHMSGRNSTSNQSMQETTSGVEAVELSSPIKNPVLFMDIPSAPEGHAEGTGFRALQLARSVCDEVSVYGYSVDVGYQRWGKYFTRDGPGHVPLLGIMYYQTIECLGVASLRSSARTAGTPVATGATRPLLEGVNVPSEASVSLPKCSRWARALTPHFLGRNSCNSRTAHPLNESHVGGEGLRIELLTGKASVREYRRAASEAQLARASGGNEQRDLTNASSNEKQSWALDDEEKTHYRTNIIEKHRFGGSRSRTAQFKVTRYLDHFNWTRHVCVAGSESDRSQPDREEVVGRVGRGDAAREGARDREMSRGSKGTLHWTPSLHNPHDSSERKTAPTSSGSPQASWISKYWIDMC